MTIKEEILYDEEASHCLIDQESYVQTYKRIKEKWGRNIANVGVFINFNFIDSSTKV